MNTPTNSEALPLTNCSLLFMPFGDSGSMMDIVKFCFVLGAAVGMVVISPSVASQRISDDLMMGEFDSDDQWNTLRADLHRESRQIKMPKSLHAVSRRFEPALAESPTADAIASSGTHKSGVRLSTRLLRLLGKLLLPPPKRFRVSWSGIISSTNASAQASPDKTR